MEMVFSVHCLPEDLPIRGNCMCSGDDEADEAAALEIERQLDAGNEWAWCTIEVKAQLGSLHASSHLGCCSYESEEAFKACPYFEDMKTDACELIRDKLDALKQWVPRTRRRKLVDREPIGCAVAQRVVMALTLNGVAYQRLADIVYKELREIAEEQKPGDWLELPGPVSYTRDQNVHRQEPRVQRRT